MNRDYLRRYLLLILVLIICAGVAWYLTNATGLPADDAVLAKAYDSEKGACPEDSEDSDSGNLEEHGKKDEGVRLEWTMERSI